MGNGRVLAPFLYAWVSQRTNAHRVFEDFKVGRAPRLSRRLSSVAARRASPLDSALRVDWETTLGRCQLHPDVTHMRRRSKESFA
mmetsp:Transcript_34974/g.111737  ORF Transcript_34974/g.111737 Transcript_34974/m.111737 type:complete len:85 (+) Transcript_34974:1853-2107(+)